MPKSFELEPGTQPLPDNAPNVTELANDADAPPAAPEGRDKKPDTAGIEQFLKAQIGSDRYKEVAGAEKPASEQADEPGEDETPQRGPDGKFLKAPKKKAEAEKPKKADEKKPAQAPKPAPFKPKAAATTAAQLTPEQVVAAAAEGAARAIASSKTKEEESKPDASKKPAEPELSPDDQDKVEILAKMEQINPAKYKGIAQKYKSSVTALEEYAKKWEKENPGQPFDEEAPEHEAFFTENDVDWSDLDFQKAIAKMMVEDGVKGVTDKTENQLAELKRSETLRQKQSEIIAEQNTAALSFWRELGDDTADVLNADGSLNMVKVKELQDADPEAWNIRVAAAQSLDLEVAEIYKLYNGLVDNDWEKNPIHRNINQFAFQKEKEMAGKQSQDKMNAEGKLFVPAAEWFRMTKADRERHWTFSAQDLAFMRSADLAGMTQRRLQLADEAFKRQCKARGIQLENPDEKPQSPSAGGESRMAAVNESAPKKASNVAENFLRVQVRGS